jgi:hypothetical protein
MIESFFLPVTKNKIPAVYGVFLSKGQVHELM